MAGGEGASQVPLTSGSRSTLQYLTPLRSLGGEQATGGDGPEGRLRARTSTPPPSPSLPLHRCEVRMAPPGEPGGCVWSGYRPQRVERGAGGAQDHTLTFYTARSCTCCHLGREKADTVGGE